jgi:hypothetical protein
MVGVKARSSSNQPQRPLASAGRIDAATWVQARIERNALAKVRA